MAIFFTSDNHFGHFNIIKYCNRPFSSIEEMDQTMIKNWNKTVQKGDTVYCLGDFLFTKDKERNKLENILLLLNSLNGTKHLIIGNHDNKNVIASPGWASSSHLHEVSINGQLIVMCHYAMRTWNRSHHGSWHIYGHSHGTLPGHGKSVDVGVDSFNFTPVSFEQLKTIMDTLDNAHEIKDVGR